MPVSKRASRKFKALNWRDTERGGIFFQIFTISQRCCWFEDIWPGGDFCCATIAHKAGVEVKKENVFDESPAHGELGRMDRDLDKTSHG